MGKTARAKHRPDPRKQPLADKDAVPHVESKRPVWRLRRLDWGGPFPCNALDAATLEAVVKKLGHFETMTWDEIARGGSHAIGVGSLCLAARKRLDEIGQADVDDVFSLRLEGKARVFGVRDRWILDLLWWDPDHQVCPYQKKHT